MDHDSQKQFLDLYVANQRKLYGYITTLVPNRADAEEIFSQTTLVLWEKWSQFDRSRSFIAWACGIAYYEVLKYRARNERRWEGLSNDVLTMISEDRQKLQNVLDHRSAALLKCIARLKQWQQELLKKCYSSAAASIKDVAGQLGITPNALSSRLRRIRQLLHSCVDRTLRLEERHQ